MALKSTVYKAVLHISDMDRDHYHEYHLTLARHPSETDERLMVRLLAFAMYADERLEFGKGVSSQDEPALWSKDFSGDILLWLEVGLPNERRIRQACARVQQVVLLVYGSNNAVDPWWEQHGNDFKQRKNLTIIRLSPETSQKMALMADRTMQLTCMVEGGQVSLMNETSTVLIEKSYLLTPNK